MAISDLTEQEQLIWDTRHAENPLLPLDRVAQKLSIDQNIVNRVYDVARGKLGLKHLGQINANAFENRDPEKAAEVFQELSARDRTIVSIAEEMNLPYGLVQALNSRLTKKMIPLERALGDVKKSELKDLFLNVSWRVMARVTDEDIENASLRDKLVAAAIAVDKVQALDNVPSQVFSIVELQNLDKLSVMLLREVERRQLEVDVDPQTNVVEIQAGPERL